MGSSIEMIRVCEEKIEHFGTSHIKTVWLDLEHTNYARKFDIIYNQMVLHHVIDVESMLKKFHSHLNSDGYLAIADLYPEDGSFHGPEVKVHWGFDPEKLNQMMISVGFKNIEYKTCFELKRESGKIYPVFLLVAQP